MIEAITMLVVYFGMFAVIGLGVHFGTKYINRMLGGPHRP